MLAAGDYHAHLERDARAVIEDLRAADLDAAVPSCPGWTIRDLGRHLGAVHRWALEIVRTGRPGDEPAGPQEREALVAWMEQGAAALLDAVRTADPEAPTWTFGPEPRRASFWSRRQAHETSMHLVDARQSVGDVHLVDAVMASDGINEVVTVFFPRQVRLGRLPPLAHGIRLTTTDGSRESFVLAGDGTHPASGIHATITGSAADLLLALWGRAGFGPLTVDGDPALVRTVLRSGITP